MSLFWHNFYCPGQDFASSLKLPQQIPKKVVEFAYWLGEHCERTWEILDLGRNPAQPSDLDDDGKQPTSPPRRQRRLSVDALGKVLADMSSVLNAKALDTILRAVEEDWARVLQDQNSPLSTDFVQHMMHTVLLTKDVWIWFTKDSLRDTLVQAASAVGKKAFASVSYTHLTLPTKLEV